MFDLCSFALCVVCCSLFVVCSLSVVVCGCVFLVLCVVCSRCCLLLVVGFLVLGSWLFVVRCSLFVV